MPVVDLHVAPVADEMGVCASCVIHTVVVDAEDANVFGKCGEAAGAAEQAIGGNRRGHAGRPMNYGQGSGQEPPQSTPISSPF